MRITILSIIHSQFNKIEKKQTKNRTCFLITNQPLVKLPSFYSLFSVRPYQYWKFSIMKSKTPQVFLYCNIRLLVGDSIILVLAFSVKVHNKLIQHNYLNSITDRWILSIISISTPRVGTEKQNIPTVSTDCRKRRLNVENCPPPPMSIEKLNEASRCHQLQKIFRTNSGYNLNRP